VIRNTVVLLILTSVSHRIGTRGAQLLSEQEHIGAAYCDFNKSQHLL